IFYAFYNSIDPKIIQNKLNNNDEYHFEKIQILDENECYLLKPNSLLISQNIYMGVSKNSIEEQTPDYFYHDTISSLERFTDKRPIAYIYETNRIPKEQLNNLRLKCEAVNF
ncbi:MAG TPA: hypothetical protein PLM16_00950, partial [Candidatus Woesebacteria bacterium]|nr:hypothetical protein [Candidatus Woesebacteria bacterium]